MQPEVKFVAALEFTITNNNSEDTIHKDDFSLRYFLLQQDAPDMD